jgi:hypothetical protein
LVKESVKSVDGSCRGTQPGAVKRWSAGTEVQPFVASSGGVKAHTGELSTK